MGEGPPGKVCVLCGEDWFITIAAVSVSPRSTRVRLDALMDRHTTVATTLYATLVGAFLLFGAARVVLGEP